MLQTECHSARPRSIHQLNDSALARGRFPLGEALLSRRDVTLNPNEPVLASAFTNTAEAGSYNMVVSASGTVPTSGLRFVRKEMVSVLVR